MNQKKDLHFPSRLGSDKLPIYNYFTYYLCKYFNYNISFELLEKKFIEKCEYKYQTILKLSFVSDIELTESRIQGLIYRITHFNSNKFICSRFGSPNLSRTP